MYDDDDEIFKDDETILKDFLISLLDNEDANELLKHKHGEVYTKNIK